MTIYKENVREMNKKQVIRINESRLKQIISETMKNILEEEQENTYKTLIEIMTKLDMIMHSGFIPFSSPSPSSTEKKVADSIRQANELLKQAAIGCKQLGYGLN